MGGKRSPTFLSRPSIPSSALVSTLGSRGERDGGGRRRKKTRLVRMGGSGPGEAL